MGEIPKGELIHPNGFYIVATFFEYAPLKNFGPMALWVQKYVQTQQPYWVVTTCTSGGYRSLAGELKLFNTLDTLEEFEQPRHPKFKKESLNAWVDSRFAVAFSFLPVGIKDIIDGYPWRTEAP